LNLAKSLSQRTRHPAFASYYERSLTSLATLCVEKGIVTQEDLERLAQGAFPLSEPSAPGRTNLPNREQFKPGDRVRVKNDFFAGHVRMPGYIRGKSGVVVNESPRYPFPDAHAHGVEAADEPTYEVAFRTEDLWPNSSDPALVHVGVIQSYLEREAEGRGFRIPQKKRSARSARPVATMLRPRMTTA
jgi:nitrile hydratase subunit beta